MLNKYLILIIAFTLLSACGGGGGGSDPTPPPPPPANTAPVANAGTDQTVETGVSVTLNGGSSSDANGDTLTYAWTITSSPSGSSSVLSAAGTVNATFTPDIAGTYVAQLIVNDGRVASAADTVTVTATAANMAPIANAGVDQSVITGATVNLDGTASADPEGDNLTYTWSIANAPSNSTAVLSDAQVATPSFVANVDGVYTLELVVNDGDLSSAADSVTITASTPNTVPVANAGADQNISTASLVTLDGSASNDADGDTITYIWSLTSVPQNSNASLSDVNAVSPTFTADIDGTYTAQLIVNDGLVNSQADLVNVVATTANSAPVANAGVDANVATGTTVTLDASASSDSNGDMISYLWSLSSVPTGSSAVLSSTTSAMPSFTADLDGTYVASLVVSDGALSSQADTVTITATTTNVAPVANAGLNQNVITTTVVTLDGSASSDANSDTLTYAWSLITVPTGSSSALTNTDQAVTTFTPDAEGTYIAQLVVNDGTENSQPDTVSVVATRTNAAPVADAGANDTILEGFNARLDGTGSSDADDDPLTYLWSFTSQPTGSLSDFNDNTSATPLFNVDQTGEYVVSLVVNDGRESSAPSTVTFQAVTPSITLSRQENRESGAFDPIGFSYNALITAGITTNDPDAANVVIATFKLIMTGRDYTFVNVSAVNTDDANSPLAPSFGNITDGQILTDGTELTFTLNTPPTGGATVNYSYFFQILETGQVFSVSVSATTR